MIEFFDVAIIGAGPGGMEASLQASDARTENGCD